MVYHTVYFKLKPEITRAEIDETLLALNTLPGLIDEIEFLQAGINFSKRSQGYSLVLVSRFADRDALATYSSHPDHVKVVNEKIKPIVEDTIAGDIEF